MRKQELVKAVAAQAGVDTRTAREVVDATIDVILATVAAGAVVNISGFSKYAAVHRPSRMARNPATGASVRVKAKTVAKITPLKNFKDVALGVVKPPQLNAEAALLAGVKAPSKKAAAPVKKAPAKKAASPVKKAPAKKAAARR